MNDEAQEKAADERATPEGDRAAERPRRSRRHVKAAARLLQKEARKILAKHGRRIAAGPADAIRAAVAAIDAHRDAQDWEALEEEAERLDELLHQHASFARKSALRETVENISVAVLIALGLRSCFYEPFKIPSGSMMPTLRAGDHIFVNKFVYGIQIPFTTTVVGESIGEIERGDVIVFRYPLDESEDFIKRVVGLPGDEIKVSGRTVAIKRAGQDEFTALPRERLEERCRDDQGEVEPGCTLYEETLGDKTYVVRYVLSADERSDRMADTRVLRVPEGHLLVMGDNRNQSHDSLAWTVQTEAVGADHLLTLKDLRDLTDDKQFSVRRPSELSEVGEPTHDSVTYLSIHRSRLHDLSLSVWRNPTLGARSVFEAVAERIDRGKPRSIEQLLHGKKSPRGARRDRVLEVGQSIDAMVVGRSGDRYSAAIYLESPQAVLWLECGRRVCRHGGQLAARVADVVSAFHRDHEQDARVLLQEPKRVRYNHHWTGRGDAGNHMHEHVFAKPGGKGPRSTVRLRAFRKPDEGVELVRDAALRAVGSSTAEAEALPDLGEDAWLVETEQTWAYVGADHIRDMALLLECGKNACRDRGELVALARKVRDRAPRAASDRNEMKRLLLPEDVGGWTAIDVARPELRAFDRVRLEATVRGKDHAVEVEAWLDPPEGLPAQLDALRSELGLEPDDSVAPEGLAAESDEGFTFVFGVPESDTVVRVTCRAGLCSTREEAVAMARVAASKATDPTSFIDPEAERPRPFVPRGNVKGRAERIWLPLSRFWLPIR